MILTSGGALPQDREPLPETLWHEVWVDALVEVVDEDCVVDSVADPDVGCVADWLTD